MIRKKIERIVENLKKLYNLDVLEKMAEKHLFIRREGKVSARSFLNLCTFQGEELCSASLVALCAKLEANEMVSISPQGLSKRFNTEAVNFMKNVFYSNQKIGSCRRLFSGSTSEELTYFGNYFKQKNLMKFLF